jgi:class 3 adenylate cyclase/pimeloyl-ACP methyl ester carboxylesterase
VAVREAPTTRFTRAADGAMLAYQVVGHGPDLVAVGGPASHVDLEWEEESVARCLRRFASFSRLLRFDRRGTGLSDPAEAPPTLEQQVDDLRTVVAAAGMRRPALMGAEDAGLCAMYAASFPDQVSGLVLANVVVSGQRFLTSELRRSLLDSIEQHWGEGRMVEFFAPSRVGDERFEEWWARYERSSTTPAMARRMVELSTATDLGQVLPAVRAPTLVICTPPAMRTELVREVADLIPGARFVEIPGPDLFGWAHPESPWIEEIEQFLTGRRSPPPPERVLATVMFTDIVGSTELARRLGDRKWRELLDDYEVAVRLALDASRGRWVKSTGDGTLATFDGPARAVRCALSLRDTVAKRGLALRIGLHTGEVEVREDGDVAGIAVHLARRVQESAAAGEVIVSRTVVDLVAGSGIEFADRGEHQLKGVPGYWGLFAAC